MKKSGFAYTIGRNNVGQLGLGDNNDREYPVALPSDYNGNITQVSSFSDHCLILRNKEAYSFGNNNYGQLGIGNTNNKNIPQLIVGYSNLVMVSAGVDFSMILNSTGFVFSFGRNNDGRLGRGTLTTSERLPDLVSLINGNIKKIYAGGTSSGILTQDGRVYVFGYNREKQLGQGSSSTESSIPILPNNVFSKIRNICVGDRFTLLLTYGGKVYGFGENNDGQLGVGDQSTKSIPTAMLNENFNIIDFSCGDQISFVIQSRHSCYGKSYNDDSICNSRGVCISQNNCSCGNEYSGVQCEFTFCFGKNSSDPTVCSGNGACNDTNVCLCYNGFGGKDCSFKFQGESDTILYTTGENDFGLIGDGTKINRNNITKVLFENYAIKNLFSGVHHSSFQRSDNAIFTYGRNTVKKTYILIV